MVHFSAETSEKKSDETRSRIFETAQMIIRDVGVDRLTIRKLGEACGVSAALIIQYFGSKDRLLLQVFEDDLNAEVSILNEEMKHWETFSLEDRLGALADFMFTYDDRRRDLTSHIVAWSTALGPEGESVWQETVCGLLKAIRDVIRMDGEIRDSSLVRDAQMSFLANYLFVLRLALTQNIPLSETQAMIRPILAILSAGIKEKRSIS